MYGTTMMGLLGGSQRVPSLSFNGSTSGLLMAHGDFGSYDRAKFAIAVTVKFDSNSQSFLWSKADSGGNSEFSFYLNTSQRMVFDVKTTGINGFFESTETFSNSVRYDLYAVFDYLNATSSDRIKIYSNGAALTAFSFLAPDSPAMTTLGSVYIGKTRLGSSIFDGLMNQPAFFSGTIPTPAAIYNADNRLIRLAGQAGLYSYLIGRGGDSREDDVLVADWTANSVAPTLTPVQP
jgi:hypothetical protein